MRLGKAITVAAWLAYFWLWIRVFRFTTTEEAINSVALLLSMTIVYGAGIVLWIVYNIKVIQARDRRRFSNYRVLAPKTDYLSRPIQQRTDIQQGQEIVVELQGTDKCYSRADDPDPSGLLALVDSVGSQSVPEAEKLKATEH